MLNKHEVLVLFVYQIAMIFMIQNLYPVFSTYGLHLPADDRYLVDAKANNSTDLYKYSGVERYYSTHAELLSRQQNVNLVWWRRVSTIQVIGVFFGSLSFGWIADKVGRKTVCQYSLLFSSVVLLVEGFLTDPLPIAICRFLIGTQTGAIIVVSWSLATELISPRTRFLARAFANWPNGKVFLVLICYLSQNWRISLHVSAAVTLITSLLYFFVLPESPTWLHCHGQREKAEEVRNEIFRKSDGNCVITLPTNSRIKTLTFSQIWSKPKYRKIIILFGAIWIMTNFTGTMLDFSEVVIFKNLMYSQMLLAVIPSVAKMLLGLVEIYLGIISRRNLHLFSLLVNGLSMLAAGILTTLHLNKSYPITYTIVYLIGYSSVEFVWDACFLCVVEQVPTEVRGTISGTCSFFSRVAAVLATNMTDVKEIWEPAPLFTATVTAAVHFAIAYFFLDESKDAQLGEVGFDLRRISQKISSGLNRIRNTTLRRNSVVPNPTVTVTDIKI